MECQRRVKSLVVLTLLQLCRAEIKDAQPQWYSANIINDGFQPKPISELFSTETPFSTANPIIVSSQSNSLSEDAILVSTLAPPTSLLTTAPGYGGTSTTLFPSSSLPPISSFPTSQSTFSTQSTLPQQYIPRLIKNQQSFQHLNQPSVVIQQPTSQAGFEQMQSVNPLLKLVSEMQSHPQRNVQIQQEQSTSSQTLPPNPSVIKLTTFFQPPPSETTVSRDLQFQFPQETETSPGPQSSTPRPPQTDSPQSNYFLIYQQGPQSIQNYPNPSSSPQISAAASVTTSAPPVTSTLSSTFSSPTPTFSTIGGIPVSVQTSPFLFSTTSSPVTQQLLSTPPKVTVTSLSTIGSSIASTSSGTRLINCMLPKQTTPIPRIIPIGRPMPLDGLFPLKIRVLTPSGSITNVNFNPTVKPPVTTQKYIAYTITRKPTTRRTPKPRKNTYERCLQGCRKNGQTLCAAPLSQYPVDPKTLRGFPSVCHMACHNSYRKDAFEKIVDGSCGKLRNRIRPIDSSSKLKRDELQKLQYVLDNSGPPTVLEFSGAYA